MSAAVPRMASEGIASCVTLPLRQADHIVGLFSLSSRARGAFSADDLGFLEQVAGIVESQIAASLAG